MTGITCSVLVATVFIVVGPGLISSATVKPTSAPGCGASCLRCSTPTKCDQCMNSTIKLGPRLDGTASCAPCTGNCDSCTTAGSGKCDKCSEGNGPVEGGSCGSCADNCAECFTAGYLKCDKCMTGYNLNPSATEPGDTIPWCLPTSTVAAGSTTRPASAGSTARPASGGSTIAAGSTARPASGGSTMAVGSTARPASGGSTMAAGSTARPASGGSTIAAGSTARPASGGSTMAAGSTARPGASTMAAGSTAMPGASTMAAGSTTKPASAGSPMPGGSTNKPVSNDMGSSMMGGSTMPETMMPVTTSQSNIGGGNSTANAGAIAGGVVGGMALIAIIGIIWCFISGSMSGRQSPIFTTEGSSPFAATTAYRGYPEYTDQAYYTSTGNSRGLRYTTGYYNY